MPPSIRQTGRIQPTHSQLPSECQQPRGWHRPGQPLGCRQSAQCPGCRERSTRTGGERCQSLVRASKYKLHGIQAAGDREGAQVLYVCAWHRQQVAGRVAVAAQQHTSPGATASRSDAAPQWVPTHSRDSRVADIGWGGLAGTAAARLRSRRIECFHAHVNGAAALQPGGAILHCAVGAMLLHCGGSSSSSSCPARSISAPTSSAEPSAVHWWLAAVGPLNCQCASTH